MEYPPSTPKRKPAHHLGLRAMVLVLLLQTANNLPPLSSVSAGQPPSDQSPPVPAGHWAYDAMSVVAQRDFFTGEQDGTFGGRRVLTRRVFTSAVRHVLADVERQDELGVRRDGHREEERVLPRLVREFWPELSADGATPPMAADTLERYRRLWRDPRPRGVRTPLALPLALRMRYPLWPPDHRARQKGAVRAAEEWSRGSVALWTVEPIVGADAGPSAVPLRFVPEATRDARALQVLAGHNVEVWRRLRESSPRDARRFPWLSSVLEPPKASPSVAGKASALNWPVSSPDDRFRLSWAEYCGDTRRYAEMKVSLGGGQRELPIPWCDADSPVRPEVLWGPPGSTAAWFRVKSGSETRFYCIELRSGIVLGASAT